MSAIIYFAQLAIGLGSLIGATVAIIWLLDHIGGGDRYFNW